MDIQARASSSSDLERDLVGLLPSPVGGVEGQAQHAELAERAQGLTRELRIRLGLRGTWRELAGREVLDQGHEVDGLLGGHQARDGGALPCVPHHATTSSRGCWLATMTPSGSGDHDVLDAGAVAALDVEARLDAEGHALVEDQRVPRHDVGILMRLQADAVAGAMDEQVAEPRLDEHLAGRRVDALARDACARVVDGRALGLLQGRVPGRGSPPAAARPRRCACSRCGSRRASSRRCRPRRRRRAR